MHNLKQNYWVGLATVVAGLVAFASLVTTMMAVNFNSAALANPLLILKLPRVNTSLTKWSMLLDMLGYYLLLLPLIFWLRKQLGSDGLLLRLGSFCAAAYVLIGATGAAILSVVWPYTVTAYKTADPQMQLILSANFNAFNMMVYEGLWNLLEMIFAAVWWGIAGLLLYRKGSAVLGVLTAVLGLSCLANAVSVMCGINALHQASLNIYLLLSVLWTIIMGIRVLKSRPSYTPTTFQPAEKQQAKRTVFSNS